MKLYNSLTKQKEEFTPIEDKEVKFYHCGPTVYWTQHIGNLRAMTMGDLVRRTLEYNGYTVNYVRNYTDVGHLTSDSDEGEDKMEKGAKREGLSPEEIADKYIQIFENDIKDLNLQEPTHKSKATACIDQIIEMIKLLLEKEAAYITPKAIYFDITKAKDYPAFSSRKLEDQQTGAGTGDVSDPNKKNPADFALWFFKTGVHKNALQYWESPFKSSEVENGQGFPGWHIECSVIAHEYLGQPLDIHMGGVEHLPIHHPNEIVQSEIAYGTKFVNYWLHNEHLNVNGAKMSKSEGTGFSLKEVKEKGFDPLDLRYFYLTAHYRSKQNFTWEALEAARTARLRMLSQLQATKHEGEINKDWKNKFISAVNDDINIPKALAVTWDVLKSDIPNEDKLATVLDFDKVLGLKIQENLISQENSITDEHQKEIEKLIQERELARKNKDYEKSDQIRKKLMQNYNIVIEDTPEGVVWKKAE